MHIHSKTGRKMKVLATAIQKGGQGKTKIALHLGFWGLELGLKVLFVDLDPQNAEVDLESDTLVDTSDGNVIGNLSGTLRDLAQINGCPLPADGAVASGLFDAKDDRKPVYFQENGAFIQVDSKLAYLQFNAKTFPEKMAIVRKKFEQLAEHFDVCIIDTGPGNLYPLVVALGLSDHVIAPCEMDNNAIAGLGSLTANVLKVRKASGMSFELAPLGILPNMIQKDRARHIRSLNDLRNKSAWKNHVLPVELYYRAAIDESETRPVWRTVRGESKSAAAEEMVLACMYIYKLVGLERKEQ
ncbi:ParA family protein [Herbaspirillum sp.]|uniref:ParA family protein n=1 Tax=Herbaspirillum sp. TaxID=1890675 RepID=UPI000C0B36E3|nr:ParA family protein [Herbaspirillum sp.]MAF04666.1 hypothetical protein [Herbaspirillum sp.]|tara:strand:- start:376 stop:1272 length:897 start_codon:yes stop_codon:yes gene_type:complete